MRLKGPFRQAVTCGKLRYTEGGACLLMFRLVAVLVLCGVPGTALAQRAQAAAPAPSLPPIGLPLPQIGLPLPSIGLPLPTLGLPPAPASGRRDAGFGPRRTGDGRPPDRLKGRGSPTIVYFATPYLPLYPTEQSPTPGLSARPLEPMPLPPPTGRIRLDLEPVDDLQVFVDDVFVGTLADLGAELELHSGVRRLEMRAPGHEPVAFDASIVEGRTITYRGRLQLAATAPRESPRPEPPVTAPATPSRRQTFYLIPGCYMGNVPPQEVKLPRDCDLSRVITYRP
jgi:hypothetical protein